MLSRFIELEVMDMHCGLEKEFSEDTRAQAVVYVHCGFQKLFLNQYITYH